MTLDLRPLSVGEIFDRAFTLYRRNLWLFVGITALPAAFGLAMALIGQSMQRVMLTALPATREDPVLASSTGLALVGLAIGLLVFFVVYWIVYMIALGATTHAVSELYVGRSASVRQSYSGMRGRILALLVLMLLVGIRFVVLWIAGTVTVVIGAVGGALLHPLLAGLLMIFGLLAVVLIGIFMMLRYGMSVPALVVEGLSPGDAIRRSIALTKGRLPHVFLLVLCAMMVSFAGALIFQGPFAAGAFLAGPGSTFGLWLDIAGAVSGSIAGTFTAPFLVIGLALLYYDARIREEGFDLQLTLEALDARAVTARV